MAGGAPVYEVQARDVGARGEQEPTDRRRRAGLRGLEHEERVARRQPLHVLHDAAAQERRELGEQLGDVPRGEVQLSSSSTL